MIDIRWSAEAADDFTAVIEHVRHADAAAAVQVADLTLGTVAKLVLFPQHGRSAPDNTRVVDLEELPYAVVYRMDRTVLQVVRVLPRSG